MNKTVTENLISLKDIYVRNLTFKLIKDPNAFTNESICTYRYILRIFFLIISHFS